MSAEAYRPSTQILEPDITGLPRQYVSSREVPAEYTAPARGSLLSEIWGPTYAGHFVVAATIQPYGKTGILVETLVHCSPGAWVVLYGSERNRELNAAVGFSQQIVTTPSAATVVADPLSEYTIINEALSLKRTIVVPTAALAAYLVSLPTTCNLDIPDVLTGIEIDWNETGDTGGFTTTLDVGTDPRENYELSTSESGSAHSSAGHIPSIRPVVKEYRANNIPSTTHYFFLPLPVTAGQILAKVSATAWPIFKPESVSITLKGAKKSVQSSVSASASQSHSDEGDRILVQTGEGDGYDIGLNSSVETIRPTIHAAITLSGTATKSTNIEAESSVAWSGTNFPTVAVTKTASATVAASVSPTSIGATSPAAVPTSGIYLVSAKVETFDWGYVMVAAETFDASIFA